MAEVKINARIRPGKSKHAKQLLRGSGRIPAVVYGKGISSESIEIYAKDLETAIRMKGRNALIDLVVKGQQKDKNYMVMVKEVQREAIRGNIMHADLYKVSLKDKIHTAVPVAIRGEAPGVANGGIIQSGQREIEIECMPTKIPESIAVDISSLEIGGHLSVSDLPESPDYKILTEPEAILVTILAPRMAEQPETTGMEGPAVAPAVGTEDKQEKQEGE